MDKTRLFSCFTLLALSLTFSSSIFAYPHSTQMNIQRPAVSKIKGCKPSCAGIPAGQCSCVSIEGYTCCGKRTDSLTSKQTKESTVKGCKPTCEGIPPGKCSCVSMEGYTCCGERTGGIKAKNGSPNKTKFKFKAHHP